MTETDDDAEIDWSKTISAIDAVIMLERRFGLLGAKAELADRMRDGLIDVYARRAWDSSELDVTAAWKRIPDEDDPEDNVELDIAVKPFVWRQSKQWLIDLSNWRWPSGRFSTVQRRSPALRYMFEDVHFLRTEIEALRDGVRVSADRLQESARNAAMADDDASGKSARKAQVGPRLRDKAWAAVILKVISLRDTGELTVADSDDAAHLFRSDRAHHSELMPPGRECLIDGLVCH